MEFKKTSCRHVEFKKVPCRMSLKPKKGCVAVSNFRGLHPQTTLALPFELCGTSANHKWILAVVMASRMGDVGRSEGFFCLTVFFQWETKLYDGKLCFPKIPRFSKGTQCFAWKPWFPMGKRSFLKVTHMACHTSPTTPAGFILLLD